MPRDCDFDCDDPRSNRHRLDPNGSARPPAWAPRLRGFDRVAASARPRRLCRRRDEARRVHGARQRVRRERSARRGDHRVQERPPDRSEFCGRARAALAVLPRSHEAPRSVLGDDGDGAPRSDQHRRAAALRDGVARDRREAGHSRADGRNPETRSDELCGLHAPRPRLVSRTPSKKPTRISRRRSRIRRTPPRFASCTPASSNSTNAMRMRKRRCARSSSWSRAIWQFRTSAA